jgi:hypothetical protein
MPSPIPECSEAFGKQVALSTNNEADIAGYYPYPRQRGASTDLTLEYRIKQDW